MGARQSGQVRYSGRRFVLASACLLQQVGTRPLRLGPTVDTNTYLTYLPLGKKVSMGWMVPLRTSLQNTYLPNRGAAVSRAKVAS